MQALMLFNGRAFLRVPRRYTLFETTVRQLVYSKCFNAGDGGADETMVEAHRRSGAMQFMNTACLVQMKSYDGIIKRVSSRPHEEGGLQWWFRSGGR